MPPRSPDAMLTVFVAPRVSSACILAFVADADLSVINASDWQMVAFLLLRCNYCADS